MLTVTRREPGKHIEIKKVAHICNSMHVCVCERDRDRARETERERETYLNERIQC